MGRTKPPVQGRRAEEEMAASVAPPGDAAMPEVATVPALAAKADAAISAPATESTAGEQAIAVKPEIEKSSQAAGNETAKLADGKPQGLSPALLPPSARHIPVRHLLARKLPHNAHVDKHSLKPSL